MHMADALISPEVGGVMWAVSAGSIAVASRCVTRSPNDSLAPMMGAAGAFVFAAQMINFTIPGTGSSGHLGGGLLLAVLLGPHAALLVMASILAVQALFFADGGLLALGCNIFNLGFVTCWIAYPLIFRPIAGDLTNRRRVFLGALAASIVGLQLGALGVVLETAASGISDLSIGKFLLLMLPIHLAIGLVEGLVTAAVILFVLAIRPEMGRLHREQSVSWRGPAVALALAAVLCAGGLSLLASEHPDGLEWSVARTTGQEELAAPADGLHQAMAGVQERVAGMPDYSVPQVGDRPMLSTSLAGLIGAAIVLAISAGAGWVLGRRRPREMSNGSEG